MVEFRNAGTGEDVLLEQIKQFLTDNHRDLGFETLPEEPVALQNLAAKWLEQVRHQYIAKDPANRNETSFLDYALRKDNTINHQLTDALLKKPDAKKKDMAEKAEHEVTASTPTTGAESTDDTLDTGDTPDDGISDIEAAADAGDIDSPEDHFGSEGADGEDILEGDEITAYNNKDDIFRSFENAEIAAALKTSRFMSPKEMNLKTMRAVFVRLPGLMYDPQFLDTLDELAEKNDLTRDEIVEKGRKVKISRAREDGSIEEIEVDAQEAMFHLLSQTEFYAKAVGQNPDGSVKYSPRGFLKADLERYRSPLIPGGWQKHHTVSFSDANSNSYRQNGNGITLFLKPADKNGPAEKFTASVALNLMDMHIAVRNTPESTLKSDMPREMDFKLTTGKTLSRIIPGLHNEHGRIRDMMILAALDASDRKNVLPDIKAETGLGMSRVTNFDLDRMNPDAVAEMAAVLGMDRLVELSEKYSRPILGRAGPRVSSDDPAPTTPAHLAATDPTPEELMESEIEIDTDKPRRSDAWATLTSSAKQFAQNVAAPFIKKDEAPIAPVAERMKSGRKSSVPGYRPGV